MRGFDAKETILYFQREHAENLLESRKVEIQAIWSGSNHWKTVATFTMPSSGEGWDGKFKDIDIIGGVNFFKKAR